MAEAEAKAEVVLKIVCEDGKTFDMNEFTVSKCSVLKNFIEDTKSHTFPYHGDSYDIMLLHKHVNDFPSDYTDFVRFMKIHDYFGSKFMCPICKCDQHDKCVFHQKDTEVAQCGMEVGECGHSFHICCVNRWLQTRPICPVDSTEWKASIVYMS